MLWVKMFHVFFMFAWFAGLFYLPRLFVYHSMCDDAPGRARFETMERKLFWSIMTPSMVAALALGLWLLAFGGYSGGWLIGKLAVGLALVAYHAACGVHMGRLRKGKESRGHVYFRWFNEVPAIALLAALWLVVLKPF